MRAIILHSVRATEFNHCKMEITKDLSMDMRSIIDFIRQHFVAIKTNDDLIGTTPGSVKFARKLKNG